MKLSLLTKSDPLEKARKRCLKKFLHYFKAGYEDQKYFDWERGYKWNAHLQFQGELNEASFKKLLAQKEYEKVALTAVRIESRTNLLFSFEKMALRDALKTPGDAKSFAIGLYDYVYGKRSLQLHFEGFVNVIGGLSRKQTRVLTWPLLTVFGFLANPKEHIFLKPRVTKIAAEKYSFDFSYTSKPNWDTYKSLLAFAEQIRKDTKAYHPQDYIDLQSFMWVMGSDEYPE